MSCSWLDNYVFFCIFKFVHVLARLWKSFLSTSPHAVIFRIPNPLFWNVYFTYGWNTKYVRKCKLHTCTCTSTSQISPYCTINNIKCTCTFYFPDTHEIPACQRTSKYTKSSCNWSFWAGLEETLIFQSRIQIQTLLFQNFETEIRIFQRYQNTCIQI